MRVLWDVSRRWLRSRGERWAMAQFALSGLAAVAIIVLLVLIAFGRTGRDEAVQTAKEATRLAAHGVMVPNLTRAALDGDEAAIGRLDRVTRHSLLREPVLRIVVWDERGEIVYSTERKLIGTRVPLEPEMRTALRTGDTQSHVGDPARPDNALPEGTRLLDVYERIRTDDGQRLLVQSCRRLESVSADSRRMFNAFAPFVIAAVVLLQLVNLPLAAGLMRRVRRARRKEEELLQRAVAASDRERRRLASDLHSGVVQDLAGMSMSLAAAAHTATARGDEETAAQLGAVAAESRRTTRVLRHVLVDIYPPNLQRAGLRSALEDLLETVRRREIEVRPEITDDLELAPDVAALVFRVTQEALHNVISHAGATSVELRIERLEGDEVLVHVADDGRGFEPDELPESDGHLGLALMRDLVEQGHGDVAVASAPGAGTVIRARIPSA